MSYAKRILAKGANNPIVRRFWNSAVRLPLVGSVLTGLPTASFLQARESGCSHATGNARGCRLGTRSSLDMKGDLRHS